MAILKILLLFLLNSMTTSIKNKIINIKNNKNNLRSLNMIQSIPVDNNIPIIIPELNKNNNPNNIQNIHIPIINRDLNNSIHIITDTSIRINTTKKDPMCTPECCVGCEVQFQKVIMQKNCIINVCKCQIIEINSEKINETVSTNKNKTITEGNTFLLLMDNKKLFNNTENSISYTYYLFILFAFVIYEIYIIYRLNFKGFEINNNSESLKKDKEERIRDYMELVYGDEELIECFI